GLAGLPPGLAGLFAKVVVVRSLVDSDVLWLALVVAANAVLGLAYYVRVAAMLYERAPEVAGPDTAAPDAAPAVARPAGGLERAIPADPAHEPERGALLTEERPRPAPAVEPGSDRSWAVTATLALATLGVVVLGFLPQVVLWAADSAAQLLLR
ncbi:MAG: NADH-quinone oxidoreductase subunit, partial [Cryptosporangiaceae bacterium]|nr:NADH-quinone oxidoreductase subunit [Cryptosporangiaceae bacterium]